MAVAALVTATAEELLQALLRLWCGPGAVDDAVRSELIGQRQGPAECNLRGKPVLPGQVVSGLTEPREFQVLVVVLRGHLIR
ncbi:MAG TPA: hypothetical protein DCL06_07890 [Corynebacterium variabile]|uniref:Uncharacterized protein n=1 Tax=Corynebacterium variabile TaxID=1727 RepID=A0A3B9QUY0_9CORY|nr:hypothetical protein [Corynebacterium variabile]